MSATPRTDAAEYTWMNAGCDDVPVVDVDISRALERELSAVTAERDAPQDQLRLIGDFAHDHSTRPEVPDHLWKVRSMAHDGMRKETK